MIVGRKFRTATARKRERTRVTWRIVVLVLAVVGVSASLVYAIHRSELRIQQVYVNNTGAIPTDTIASAVQAMLGDSYLHLIPKNSTLAVSPKRIEATLMSSFPRIANVRVRRSGMESLSVTVEERDPVALWCGDVVPPVAYSFGKARDADSEEVWGSCYLVDLDGFIYAPAPVYTGNVLPRYYGSLERAEPTGQDILDPDEFGRFQSLFTDIAQNERTLEAVLIVDERDIEIYLGGGIRVLALRAEVPDVIVRRIRSLFSTDSFTKGREIEYIDMRFDNKVFVKYVEAEPTASVPSALSNG